MAQHSQDHQLNLVPKTTMSYADNMEDVKNITLIKIIVLFLTLVFLLSLILWPILSNKENSFTLAVDRLEKRDEKAKLVKPRYVGIDHHNNPVNISAEMAYRKSNDNDDYYLKNLLADLMLSDGSAMNIHAISGMFDSKNQQISLDGNVKMQTQTGFTLNTTEALFLINQKIASGKSGISGTAPFGDFKAERFNINVDKEIIKLSGNVNIHFNTEKTLDTPSIEKAPE